MEFTFNINEIFKEPVVEIGQNLLPPGFSGDRRALWDTVNKTSEIINVMGEMSARAQGLSKPITTAERLRSSENQKLYLLIDQNANSGKGAVTGMLKTGNKGLYVFDKEGHHYQVSPPCVLDFYVHESRQRNGLGKHLFEHMLHKEDIQPVQMALDRPSDTFLNFLNKYYALHSPVKQMNNFVVYDGFFPGQEPPADSEKVPTPIKKNSANGLQSTPSSYGRYGAPRPPCSMGQIIHNQTSTINRNHPVSEHKSSEEKSTPKLERPRSLSLQQSEEQEDKDANKNPVEANDELDEIKTDLKNIELDEAVDDNIIEEVSKSEADIMQAERKTPSHLTEQGFFDLKFYHSKLW